MTFQPRVCQSACDSSQSVNAFFRGCLDGPPIFSHFFHAAQSHFRRYSHTFLKSQPTHPTLRAGKGGGGVDVGWRLLGPWAIRSLTGRCCARLFYSYEQKNTDGSGLHCRSTSGCNWPTVWVFYLLPCMRVHTFVLGVAPGVCIPSDHQLIIKLVKQNYSSTFFVSFVVLVRSSLIKELSGGNWPLTIFEMHTAPGACLICSWGSMLFRYDPGAYLT